MAKTLVDKNVQFHNELNPKVWSGDTLDQRVRLHLLNIAKHFIDFLELPVTPLTDIVLTGSLASYNYTPYSDFDLHVVLDFDKISCDEQVLQQLFDSKKRLWNKTYPITVLGHDVELYAEDKDQKDVTNGTFSLLDDKWVEIPQKKRPHVKTAAIHAKSLDLMDQIDQVISDNDEKQANKLKEKIVKMRRAGLATTGMYGTENLTFKILRNQGYIDRITNFINNKMVHQLGLGQ
jgi:predicted nucleotidyltransferase